MSAVEMACLFEEPEAATGGHEPDAPAERVPTALVVDGDRVSRRFVELALGGEGGFSVEAVADAASALEVLGTQVIDIIVSDSMLPDMNGLQLYRRLREESRLRSVPFVFLSSDTRAAVKTLAFATGVDDYLGKPCNPRELGARARALVDRQKRQRKEKRERTYALAGTFSAIAFPDLVSIIEMARRTGTLLVTNDDVTGQIVFDDGRIVHAVYGNLTGNQAFFRFVCASDGHFEFDPSPLALGAHERTITESAMSLILEGARLSDVARRGKGIAAGRAAQSPLSLPAPRLSGSFKPRGSRAPAAAIVASVASQYEAAIRDNFTLGDLKMLTERDLAEWTEWDGDATASTSS